MNRDSYYLELLIDIIINNSKMDYLNQDLRIDDDKAVIQIIKVIAEKKYKEKINELKEHKKGKEISKE